MKKLFFFHLPKAGGTSINAILSARYDPAQVAPNIENDVQGHTDNRGDYDRHRGYAYYSGHYGMDIYEAVSNGHMRIGNFRNPVERIYSLYRFFREVRVDESNFTKRHYAALKTAKCSSLADFVTSDDEIVLTYTSNQHARQLTGSPWALQSNIDAGAAIAAIDEMECFYICEQPDQSAKWLNQVIGVEAIPQLNVTVSPPTADEISSVAALIMERNKLDLLLYDHALCLLKQKFEAA